MKLIKSKLLQKAEGKRKGKYLITLEVSDYDIEMLEDLATTYEPFQEYHNNKEKLGIDFELPELYFTTKYEKWIKKTWHEFWKLWKIHDNYA